MDIAELKMTADSSGIVRATVELDRLYTAAARAESETTQLTGTIGRVGGITGRFNQMMGSSASVIERFASKSGGAIGGLRGLGLQLNQVAQVGFMTGRWAEALAVQLPDIFLGFGTIGVFAGIAASALIPLGMTMSSARSEAEMLAEKIEELEGATDDYINILQQLDQAQTNGASAFGRYAQQAEQVLEALAQIRREATNEAVRAILGDPYESATGTFRSSESARDLLNANAGPRGRALVGELVQSQAALFRAEDTDAQLAALDEMESVIRSVLDNTNALNFGMRDQTQLTEAQRSKLQEINELRLQLLEVAAAETNQERERLRAMSERAGEMGRQFEEARDYAETQRAILADQVNIQETITQYGRESTEAVLARVEAERAAYEAKLRNKGVSEVERDVLLQMWDAAEGIASADVAEQLNQIAFGYATIAEMADAAAKAYAEKMEFVNEERASMNDRLAIAVAEAKYGQDSVQAVEARLRAELNAYEATLDAANVTGFLKDELMAAAEAAIRVENTDMASAINAAAGAAAVLAGNLGIALANARAIARQAVQNSLYAQEDARIELETVGQPVERARRQAVTSFRRDLDDGGYGLIRGGRADVLAEGETRVGQAAAEAERLSRAANEADREWAKLQRSTGGGSGGSGTDERERYLKELEREGKRIFEDTRTAAEEYAIALQLLNEVYQEGFIDQDTYQRGLNALSDQFSEMNDLQEITAAHSRDIVSSISDIVIESENWGETMERVGLKIAQAAFEMRLLQVLFNSGPLAVEGGGNGLVGNLLGGFNFGGFGTGNLFQNASGISSFHGGRTRINEVGGEIIDLPAGSRIIPHDVSMRMASSKPTMNVNITNNAAGEVDVTPTQNSDGSLDLVIERKMQEKFRSGRMNRTMQEVFGVKPRVQGA